MTDSNVERKNHFELFNDHEKACCRKESNLAHARGEYIFRHPHFWCCVNVERKIYRHSTREDEIICGIISLPCTQNKTDTRSWVIYNHESSTDTLRYLQLRLFVLFLLGVGWLGLVSCVYIYFPKHWHSNRHEGDELCSHREHGPNWTLFDDEPFHDHWKAQNGSFFPHWREPGHRVISHWHRESDGSWHLQLLSVFNRLVGVFQ